MVASQALGRETPVLLRQHWQGLARQLGSSQSHRPLENGIGTCPNSLLSMERRWGWRLGKSIPGGPAHLLSLSILPQGPHLPLACTRYTDIIYTAGPRPELSLLSKGSHPKMSVGLQARSDEVCDFMRELGTVIENNRLKESQRTKWLEVAP